MEFKFGQRLLKEMVMKVTNICIEARDHRYYCLISFLKIRGCEIQDISTSIPIKSRNLNKMNELTEMSYGTDDESDKHI